METKHCDKCGTDYTTPYCGSVQCLSAEVLGIYQLPEGGRLTYVYGYKYPARGLPEQPLLNFVDILKRVLIASVRLVMSIPLTPRRAMAALQEWISDIYRADYQRHQLPLNHFSQPSRELIRVLTKINNYTEEDMAVSGSVNTSPDYRDIGRGGWIYYLVMIFETDWAYRFRTQDILQLLDKEALKRNPRREIKRLVNVLIEREVGGAKHKFVLMKRVVRLALLSRTVLAAMVAFLEELNIEEIKVTINDRYWMASKVRFDYNYEGIPFEERIAWKDKEDEDYVPPQRLPVRPSINILAPGKEFYELPIEGAEIMAEDTKNVVLQNYKAYHAAHP